jgi:hypothetical protein
MAENDRLTAARGLAGLTQRGEQDVKSIEHSGRTKLRDSRQYALGRGLGYWEVTFEGRPAIFKHEQGALYVACLLLVPPSEAIHAVALALKAREMGGESGAAGEIIQQRNLGLDDAEAVRGLRRRERELEAWLDDPLTIGSAKAEIHQELSDIADFLAKNPWRSDDCARKCVRAVSKAVTRFYNHLRRAVDTQGRPHPVLQDFARHLREHVLIPSCVHGPGRLLHLRAAPGRYLGREGGAVTQKTGSVHLYRMI